MHHVLQMLIEKVLVCEGILPITHFGLTSSTWESSMTLKTCVGEPECWHVLISASHSVSQTD